MGSDGSLYHRGHRGTQGRSTEEIQKSAVRFPLCTSVPSVVKLLTSLCRSRAARPEHLVINPKQRRGGDADRRNAKPDPLRLGLAPAEVMNKHAAIPAADQRSNSDGQEREAHVSALLPGRREPRD